MLVHSVRFGVPAELETDGRERDDLWIEGSQTTLVSCHGVMVVMCM